MQPPLKVGYVRSVKRRPRQRLREEACLAEVFKSAMPKRQRLAKSPARSESALVFPNGRPAFARPFLERAIECPVYPAGSTDRRNTCVKSLCWGFKPQGLARPLVELACHFVQVSLRVDRQVSSFRKVLSQQTIAVLIGTALPRTLRIAEVNIDIGR